MKIKFFIINLIILLTFSACQKWENPPERNSLVFDVDMDDIIDSLNKMNVLLKKISDDSLINSINTSPLLIIDSSGLPDYHYKYFFSLFYTRGNTSIIKFHSDDMFKNQYKNIKNKMPCNNLTATNYHNFISLHKYLYKNKLKLSSYNSYYDLCYYTYRDYYDIKNPQDFHTDLLRFVVINPSGKINQFGKYNQVLDKYRHLYLVAFENAEIWETK